jgi:hypothetical protein
MLAAFPEFAALTKISTAQCPPPSSVVGDLVVGDLKGSAKQPSIANLIHPAQTHQIDSPLKRLCTRLDRRP